MHRPGAMSELFYPNTDVRSYKPHGFEQPLSDGSAVAATMTVEATDAQLVQRAQRGDRSAFDLLVLKYQHRILKLVSRFVSDPVEAQDVAQDAFIKAYRALGSFRNDSAFYTWMYRIAINTAKNALV